jgi:8-oxo-dGTP diphosphatase
MKPRNRVVAYITRGDKLLVFRHIMYPEAGVQTPAGHPETGESLDAAVMREAEEETGLKGLKMERYLGSKTYDFTEQCAGLERRHFYHLSYAGDSPERWLSYEHSPSDGTPSPVEFEMYWIRLRGAELDWGHGDMLDKIEC